MLTKKQRDEIKIRALSNSGIYERRIKKETNKPEYEDELITLTEQAVIEEILKETKDVEPSLVRNYIRDQLYLPYYKKQKQESKK